MAVILATMPLTLKEFSKPSLWDSICTLLAVAVAMLYKYYSSCASTF
jgi:hypothetical protein